MIDDPHMRPNDAALELLREIARTVRGVEAQVTEARTELAELRGADVPRRLRDHDERLHTHHDRLTSLETTRDATAASRKPYMFVLAQTVTAALSAGVGALVAWWVGPHG